MTQSETYIRESNKVSGGERPLLLIEIIHDDLLLPIRIVQDNEDVTHNAEVYQALAFRIELPGDEQSGMPQARLAIDNVGRELVQWLEVANFALPITVKMFEILRSNPDVVERDYGMMDLRDISMSQQTISGVLTYENLLNKPLMRRRYNLQTAPSLY